MTLQAKQPKGSSEKIFWSLYNVAEEHQVDGLSLNEALAIVRSIPKRNYRNWLAWKTGELNWKTMEEYPELTVVQVPQSKPNAKLGPDFEVTKTATYIRARGEIAAIDSEAVVNQNSREKLKSTGLFEINDKKFKVSVQGKEKSFLTSTQTLSLDELVFEDPLPEWVNDKFNVQLQWGEQFIRIVCQKKDAIQLKIARICDKEDKSLLKTWLSGL